MKRTEKLKQKKGSFLSRFFMIIIILIIATVLIYLLFKSDFSAITAPFQQNEFQNQQITTDNGSIDAYMCQVDDCVAPIINLIKNTQKTLSCATFELNNQALLQAITKAAERGIIVRIVVDSDNKHDLAGDVFRFDTSKYYMHNKFCIFDDQIIFTGSMNPTNNDIFKNDNNLLIINSSKIAANYNDEFEELWNGVYGKGEQIKAPIIELNNNTIMIQNYFCPEDHCEEHVLTALQKANQSIEFMIFSFTSDPIGNLLIEKAKQGIAVKGIFDTSQKSEFSEYQRLKNANIPVFYDKNKYKLHHKVFIIDNATIITGSYNPSQNGNEHNDENLVIITDPITTQKYQTEFERVYYK